MSDAAPSPARLSNDPSAPARRAGRYSIARLGAALLVSTALVTAASVAFVYHTSLLQALGSVLDRLLEDEARIVANEVAQVLEELEDDASFLAAASSTRTFLDAPDGSATRARLEADLLALMARKPEYLQLRLLDLDRRVGQEMLRVSGGPAGPYAVPVAGLQDKSGTTYVRDLRARSAGGVMLSEIELNREQGVVSEPRTPVLRALAPVVGAEGTMTAAFVINLDLLRFFGELRSRLSTGVEIALENDLGERVLDLDGSMPFAAAAPDVRGDDAIELRSVVPYGERSLTVRLSVSGDGRFGLADATFRRAVFGVLTATLVTLAFALVLSLRAQRPLERLLAVADDVTIEGRPSEVRFEERGPVEVRRIASALNRMLDALSASQLRLERANTELSEFAYAVSHDLKQPARTVQGLVTRLSRERGEGAGSDATRAEARILSMLSAAAERMLTLIDAMLDLARVGRDRTVTSVALGEVLRDVQADLQRVIDETGARIDLGPLPVVRGDRAELQSLNQNLIENALKFCAPGARPEIRVRALAVDGRAVIEVRDQGTGVPPRLRNKVFNMFARAHHAEEFPGTGIGLARCAKIVALHGGRIWIEDVDGPGTSVRYTLPGAHLAAVGSGDEGQNG